LQHNYRHNKQILEIVVEIHTGNQIRNNEHYKLNNCILNNLSWNFEVFAKKVT